MGPDALDFWLGTWDRRVGRRRRTNTVARELDGAVVVERFEAAPPEPWSGMSVSAYDPTTDRWRQTWVDSNGSYWHFVGTRTVEGTTFATPGTGRRGSGVQADGLQRGDTGRVPLALASLPTARRGPNAGRSDYRRASP